MILNEEFLDKLMEQVGPYISDLKSIRIWLDDRIGWDSATIVSELEKMYPDIDEETKKTDFRILLNALRKY